MIIFHKQLRQMKDDWYENLPAIIWRGPTGPLLTVVIIVFGVMAILIGAALISVAFVQTMKMTTTGLIYPVYGSATLRY